MVSALMTILRAWHANVGIGFIAPLTPPHARNLNHDTPLIV